MNPRCRFLSPRTTRSARTHLVQKAYTCLDWKIASWYSTLLVCTACPCAVKGNIPRTGVWNSLVKPALSSLLDTADTSTLHVPCLNHEALNRYSCAKAIAASLDSWPTGCCNMLALADCAFTGSRPAQTSQMPPCCLQRRPAMGLRGAAGGGAGYIAMDQAVCWESQQRAADLVRIALQRSQRTHRVP
jgi:hypothetical protein